MIPNFWHQLRQLVGLQSKPKRLELRCVSYIKGNELLRQGWTIAPEEDHNRIIGTVWLERLEEGTEQLPK